MNLKKMLCALGLATFATLGVACMGSVDDPANDSQEDVGEATAAMKKCTSPSCGGELCAICYGGVEGDCHFAPCKDLCPNGFTYNAEISANLCVTPLMTDK